MILFQYWHRDSGCGAGVKRITMPIGAPTPEGASDRERLLLDALGMHYGCISRVGRKKKKYHCGIAFNGAAFIFN